MVYGYLLDSKDFKEDRKKNCVLELNRWVKGFIVVCLEEVLDMLWI